MRDQLNSKRPRIPIAGRHVWDWFWRLDRTREGTGYGINPLQPSQIEAWFRIRRMQPQSWHLDAIEKMDATRMRVYFEKKDPPAEGKEPDTISGQPLTSKSMAYLFPGKRKKFSRDGKMLN